MTLVVDASVALKWFFDEQGDTEARELVTQRVSLVAPDLVVAEVCNGIWRAVRLGRLAASQANTIAVTIPSYFQSLVPLAPLAERAMAMALRLDHPVYDCFYLALAEIADARLVTADRRLLARIAGTEWQDRVTRLYQPAPEP